MSERFSTGVAELDRTLGGGIPPGTLVALLADPASQSELLLCELAARRETLYLTTERPSTAVTAAIRDRPVATDHVAVTAVDTDAPAVDALEYVEKLPEGALLVVDPVDPLERVDPGAFRAFLDALQSRLASTGGVAVVHALKSDRPPDQRHRTEYAADLVFDLVTERVDDRIENHLLVPKFRGGPAPADAVRLELTDRVAVDNSRDIA